MEKIWLKSYPAGVPAEINTSTYSSLADLFEHCCRSYNEHPAYANMGTTIDYGKLDLLAHQFAAFLQKILHIQKGERLAIMMPNLLQYPIAIFGGFIAGMTVVNINPLYTPRELVEQLNDAGATVIIVLANFAHIVQEVLPKTKIKHVIVTEIGDLHAPLKRVVTNMVVRYIKKMVPAWHIPHAWTFVKAMKQGYNKTADPVKLTGDDIAFLQYTGGTTGIPKAAILTHHNMVSNLEQISAWIQPFIGTEQDIIITALPLYHIFSLTANCLTFLKNGSLNVLITNPRDMKAFIKELKRYKFTVFTGVNTLFNGLLHQPDFEKLDFSHFKLALGGGMAVQKAVADAWSKITGKPLLEAYGLTETSPAVTINPLNMQKFNGSIGLPIPSTIVKICDDDGEELPLNEVGELCVKGPQVMRGYWQRPDETQKVMLKDGFLRTGDMATMDENGYIFLKERKKDMILISGFNVYPNEVEGVLAQHPGILEVAVIGEPNDHSGEIVKAIIVKKDPALTAEEVIHYARENLTGYKVPKIVEFRTELPKSNVGKILRRELREHTSPEKVSEAVK